MNQGRATRDVQPKIERLGMLALARLYMSHNFESESYEAIVILH